MVEPVKLRAALATFLGGDRFRKFVAQGVRKGRLRYWQAQEWSHVTATHPEYAVSIEELQTALRIANLPTPGAKQLLHHASRVGLKWGLAGLLLGSLIGGAAGLWLAMFDNALYGLGGDNYSGPRSRTTSQEVCVYITWFALGATLVGGLLAVVCGSMGCIRGIVEAKLSNLAEPSGADGSLASSP